MVSKGNNTVYPLESQPDKTNMTQEMEMDAAGSEAQGNERDDHPQPALKPEVLPSWDYATKKTIASGMLNVSLLLSNAAQLKSLYSEDKDHRHDLWTADVTLIVISIALQVVVAFLLFILSLLRPTEEHHRTSVYILNNTVTFIILLICIINVIISGFGIHMDDSSNKLNNSATNSSVVTQ